MLTLYSYPPLFGVADNNGYGLKVFAFLKLAGVPFRHEHIFDASKAPRSQLPYIVDGNDTVGDSETILAYVIDKYRLTIDAALTEAQRAQNLLIARGLADLAALSTLIPPRGYVHGSKPTSVDAGIYGFIANIYFYDIDTPLKAFVVAHDNVVRHCRAIHEAVR